MTPKEKAKELYDKFEKIFINANADSWGEEAKQCALIACDFALEMAKDAVEEWSWQEGITNELDYLIEVKQEIEKI